MNTKIIPPIDLDVPVTNPKLVAAIGKHQQSQTNETATELFEELKKSVFLVAAIFQKPPTKTSEGQSILNQGDQIAIVEVYDNNDNRLLALFTDHSELQRFTDKANSTLVMPTNDAMSFVLSKGYAGLVVNPVSTATLRLDAPFIRTLVGNKP